MTRRIWTRTTLMSLTLLAGSTDAYALDAGEEQSRGAARSPSARLQLAVGFDAQRAWIAAQYKQLAIRKQSSREPRLTAIELQYGADTVTVTITAAAVVVSRGPRAIVVDSPAAFEAVYDLLGSSPAVFAARAMLSELEEESALEAPEMNLLSSLAFVASLVGDLNAPKRLADRFVARYRGVIRPVRRETCWDSYSAETTAAWSDLQACMDEANQDESFFRAAYRRLACNATWALRSESAWFEFLACVQPIKTVK
jgi:hypothetical protein